MQKKFPWIERLKKTDPELPLKPPIPGLENYSNGEYLYEQTDRDRLLNRLILEKADEKARRLGMDRRSFLASTMGMCTSLSVLNAVSGCGSDEKKSKGGYDVPDAATEDCDLSRQLLDADDWFVFDMQSHHVNPEGTWTTTNAAVRLGLTQLIAPIGSNCDLGVGEIKCLGFDYYLDHIFLNSPTTMAVLSGFPSSYCTETRTAGCGWILDNDEMARERDAIEAAAGSLRMINHCNIAPNDDLAFQLDVMTRIATEVGAPGGWKLYTGWAPSGGQGWHMDDPNVGIPVIEKGLELGVPIFCVHKGPQLPGFTEEFNDARDMGVVAKAYPDAKFVVYHSGLGFKAGGIGVPYDPSVNAGVNNVIKSLEDAGLGPGSNLYAELGSLWLRVMSDPVAAQHVIGKLLKHFGEDNVLFGSECIWFGSPAPQIEALKNLTISQEFQDLHGYPELTEERRRKILGLNAAKLYGIDPTAKRCQIDETRLAMAKQQMDAELGPRRWAFQKPLGPRTRREFRELVRYNLWKNQPG